MPDADADVDILGKLLLFLNSFSVPLLIVERTLTGVPLLGVAGPEPEIVSGAEERCESEEAGVEERADRTLA